MSRSSSRPTANSAAVAALTGPRSVSSTPPRLRGCACAPPRRPRRPRPGCRWRSPPRRERRATSSAPASPPSSGTCLGRALLGQLVRLLGCLAHGSTRPLGSGCAPGHGRDRPPWPPSRGAASSICSPTSLGVLLQAVRLALELVGLLLVLHRRLLPGPARAQRRAARPGRPRASTRAGAAPSGPASRAPRGRSRARVRPARSRSAARAGTRARAARNGPRGRAARRRRSPRSGRSSRAAARTGPARAAPATRRPRGSGATPAATWRPLERRDVGLLGPVQHVAGGEHPRRARCAARRRPPARAWPGPAPCRASTASSWSGIQSALNTTVSHATVRVPPLVQVGQLDLLHARAPADRAHARAASTPARGSGPARRAGRRPATGGAAARWSARRVRAPP